MCLSLYHLLLLAELAHRAAISFCPGILTHTPLTGCVGTENGNKNVLKRLNQNKVLAHWGAISIFPIVLSHTLEEPILTLVEPIVWQ